MIDARLSATVERAITNAVRQHRTDSVAAGIADDIGRILNLAGSGGVDAGPVLAESVLNGIHLAASRLDHVRIAVTGTGWVGSGVGSVEDTVLRLLRGAKHEVLLTAYSITAGSTCVLDELERAAATGVRTCLIVDDFADQELTVKDRLRGLAGSLGHTFKLYDFGGGMHDGHLHAKAVVADRRSAVIGSAN